MDRRLVFLGAVIVMGLSTLLAGNSGTAKAAPSIPEIYDLEGVIRSATWYPRKLIRKAEPGMSGTLGIDFYAPGRYVVEMTETKVKDLSPGEYRSGESEISTGKDFTIVIYHKRDDGYLKPGMRIRLIRYQILGDEGGDWYDFNKLEIIEGAGD